MRYFSRILALVLVSISSKAALANNKVQVAGLIDSLKKDLSDKTLSADDKLIMIEKLSVEEKESIILQLLDRSNRGVQLQNSGRVMDLEHLRDIAARSFET